MKNNDFDYSYQYSYWHSDDDESKKSDIFFAKRLSDNHAIYPRGKNARVLEIGCGMGRFLLMLREQGYENLTGVDIDRSQADIAKKEGLQVFQADIVDFLKNNQGKYDVIYCFDVLEHFEKDAALSFLKLVNDSLSERGFLVIQVPNAMSPTATWGRYDDFTHRVLYTAHSLAFLLHNTGFDYLTVREAVREPLKIRFMKIPWADLYRYELGMKDMIITANIVSVAFKNKDDFAEYLSSAPIIHNDYRGVMWFAHLVVRGIRKFFSK